MKTLRNEYNLYSVHYIFIRKFNKVGGDLLAKYNWMQDAISDMQKRSDYAKGTVCNSKWICMHLKIIYVFNAAYAEIGVNHKMFEELIHGFDIT